MATFALIVLTIAVPDPAIGRVVNTCCPGEWTCATAFLLENRQPTANWLAGFWAAWDMSEITKSEPVASSSDLNGIVGEVEKVCREQRSSSLLFAFLDARQAVKLREQSVYKRDR